MQQTSARIQHGESDEGLNLLSDLIERILSRVRISITNLSASLVYASSKLSIVIPKIVFADETPSGLPPHKAIFITGWSVHFSQGFVSQAILASEELEHDDLVRIIFDSAPEVECWIRSIRLTMTPFAVEGLNNLLAAFQLASAKQPQHMDDLVQSVPAPPDMYDMLLPVARSLRADDFATIEHLLLEQEAAKSAVDGFRAFQPPEADEDDVFLPFSQASPSPTDGEGEADVSVVSWRARVLVNRLLIQLPYDPNGSLDVTLENASLRAQSSAADATIIDIQSTTLEAVECLKEQNEVRGVVHIRPGDRPGVFPFVARLHLTSNDSPLDLAIALNPCAISLDLRQIDRIVSAYTLASPQAPSPSATPPPRISLRTPLCCLKLHVSADSDGSRMKESLELHVSDAVISTVDSTPETAWSINASSVSAYLVRTPNTHAERPGMPLWPVLPSNLERVLLASSQTPSLRLVLRSPHRHQDVQFPAYEPSQMQAVSLSTSLVVAEIVVPHLVVHLGTPELALLTLVLVRMGVDAAKPAPITAEPTSLSPATPNGTESVLPTPTVATVGASVADTYPTTVISVLERPSPFSPIPRTSNGDRQDNLVQKEMAEMIGTLLGCATDLKPRGSTALALHISAPTVTLILSEQDDVAERCKRTKPRDPAHKYDIIGDGLSFLLVASFLGQNSTYARVSLGSASLWDTPPTTGAIFAPGLEKRHRVLWNRTASDHTFVLTHVETVDSHLGLKDTATVLELHGMTLDHEVGSEWLFNIIDLLIPPPSDPPVVSDLTLFSKVYVSLTQCEIAYAPIYSAMRAAITLDSLVMTANIIPDAPTRGLKFVATDVRVFILDDIQRSSTTADTGNSRWAILGYACVGRLDRFAFFVRIAVPTSSSSGPEVEVELTNDIALVDTCADSHVVLMELVQYWVDERDIQITRERSELSWSTEKPVNVVPDATEIDVLSEIEPLSFGEHAVKSRAQEPDLLCVDDHFGRSPVVVEDDVFYDGIEEVKVLWNPRVAEHVQEESQPEVVVRTLHSGESSDGLQFIDNHFSQPLFSDDDDLRPPDGYPRSNVQIRVREVNVIWRLHDGMDWPSPLPADEDDALYWTPPEEQDVEAREEVDKPQPAPKTAGPPRSSSCIECRLYGLSVQLDVFVPGKTQVQRVVFAIRDVDIVDDIQQSQWHRFLSFLPDELTPRVAGSRMVHVELETVAPNVDMSERSELRLRLSVLPIRLNIDYFAAEFLLRYFTFLPQSAPADVRVSQKQPNVFIQLCEILPLNIRIDFNPAGPSIQGLLHGNWLELLNVFSVEGATIFLPKLRLSGIQGWAGLGDAALNAWWPAIKRTQVPAILGTVGPLRPIVNIGSGAVGILLEPVRQYRRDGRLVYGVGRGIGHFLKAIAVESLNVVSTAAVTAQFLLEQADDVLYPDTSSALPGASRWADQPQGVGDGLGAAVGSITRGLRGARESIVDTPVEGFHQHGAVSALKGAIRGVPGAVLRPVAGTAEAAAKTLLGLRNEVAPELGRENADKFRPARAYDRDDSIH